MAGRTIVRRGQAPRRAMFWAGSSQSASNATNTSSVGTLVSESTLENVPNPTIIRIRGRLTCFITAIGADDAITTMTYGIMVVSAAALAGASVPAPAPANDVDSPWMWWDTVVLQKALQAGAEDTAIGAHYYMDVDSKSMRKIKQNEVLIFVSQNAAISGGAATVHTAGNFRILIKR